MQPIFLGLEKLRCSTADRETKVGIPDDALARNAIARLQVLYRGTNLHDLTRPLVTRNQGVLEGDDVPALQKLDIRVADTHRARCYEDFIAGDFRNGQFRNSWLLFVNVL